MKNERLIHFIIMTFIITGIAWGGLAIATKLKIIAVSDPLGTFLHIIGGFGPTIATFFVIEKPLTFQSIMDFVFQYKKSLVCFWILVMMEILVIGISSMELNKAIPGHLIPLVFFQAVFIYGGEEELGWRGIMQPLLEERFLFPIATFMTGIVWGIWHFPLWFVDGSSQQNMPFPFFLVLAVILSFWLASLYKKTQYVFACSVFHGLTNTLLSIFVMQLNVILLLGLIIMTSYSIYLWYETNHDLRRDEK